jgi:hypothetical protein
MLMGIISLYVYKVYKVYKMLEVCHLLSTPTG